MNRTTAIFIHFSLVGRLVLSQTLLALFMRVDLFELLQLGLLQPPIPQHLEYM